MKAMSANPAYSFEQSWSKSDRRKDKAANQERLEREIWQTYVLNLYYDFLQVPFSQNIVAQFDRTHSLV